jgi:subtilisin-like proprotein convertase family protein
MIAMQKSFFSFCFVFISLTLSFAQNFWHPIDESKINLRQGGTRSIIPSKYKTFELQNEMITSYLRQAPLEFEENFLEQALSINLPMPDGKIEEFVAWYSPLMEDGLAANYPNIKTYKAYQKTNRNNTARFSIGPNGFHAAIKQDDATIYIDPYSSIDNQNYIVYYTADHIDSDLTNKIICGTQDENNHTPSTQKWGRRNPDGKMEMRTYRLALACTGEWGEVRGTKEKALADMVAFVERANLLFEAELAIRTILIEKNDLLINLDGKNDLYTNSTVGADILTQNTNIISGKVGFSSFDIGHVFSICHDVGGIAGGTACTQFKGAGVTCHNSSGISNGIVLVFNHEVGHQLTASHTFNHCPGQEGQLSATGYEPGSGSTIMAYPGACSTSNLGAPRESYYHVSSLDQIISYTNFESSEAYLCAAKTDINNYVPVISLNYPKNFSIPKYTPFYLEGSATDENQDALTYTWEQFDNQGSSPLGMPVGNAPIFRSLKPSASPVRYFPNENRILSYEFDNVQELLPTYSRNLTFRFVVRDNNPLGNAAVWEEIKFGVTNAGPFKITYPVNEQKLVVGKKLNVTWDVANTNLPPVSCQYVDIYVSLNNSLNFKGESMKLVASCVPNDGEETIIIPNNVTNRARIVIKAHDNIFFTTGLGNSKIDLPTKPGFITEIVDNKKSSCLPEAIDFEIQTTALVGMTDSIQFEIVSGLPEGAVASFESEKVVAGSNNTLHLNLDSVQGTADYEVLVRSFAPGIDTIVRKVYISVTGTNIDNMIPFSPENGIEGVGPTQKYYWSKLEDAIEYQLQVATSPSFDTEKIIIDYLTPDTSFLSNVFLDKATIYFWRIRASNDCKIGQWSEIRAFNTETLECSISKSGPLSINITSAGTPTVKAELYFPNEGAISDVNIKNIKLSHQQSSDLIVSLIAPDGKEGVLWSKRCPSGNGVIVGLDDQSNDFFSCPISTGKIYRPEKTPLSYFNNINMHGVWTLKVEDVAAGNSGKLLNFDLELCANITLNPPTIVVNDTLELGFQQSKVIDQNHLLSNDADNQANEIKYIVVTLPTHGLLTKNSVPLKVGDSFTQEDINQGLISYHNTGQLSNDDFKFVLTDQKGGWVKITKFDILIDIKSNAEDLVNHKKVNILVYPNPGTELLHIQKLSTDFKAWKCVISDISGQNVYSAQVIDDIQKIDIQSWQKGIYFISVYLENQVVSRKFVKQ